MKKYTFRRPFILVCICIMLVNACGKRIELDKLQNANLELGDINTQNVTNSLYNLHVPSNTILLGEPFGISIIYNNNNLLENVVFKIALEGDAITESGSEFVLQDMKSLNLNYTLASAPGHWDIKAFIYEKNYHGDDPIIRETVTASIEVKFPPVEDFTSENVFTNAASEAWSLMKNNKQSGSLTEVGFWVYIQTFSDGRLPEYLVSDMQVGDPLDCLDEVGISPEDPSDQNVSDAPFEGIYPVAFFHTHTSIFGCVCPGFEVCGREVGFSPEDKAWSNIKKMPLFVYDYEATRDGTHITSNDPIHSSAFYEYYDQMPSRPTPSAFEEIEFQL